MKKFLHQAAQHGLWALCIVALLLIMPSKTLSQYTDGSLKANTGHDLEHMVSKITKP